MAQIDEPKTARFSRAAAVSWVLLSVTFVIQPPEFSPGISFPIDMSAEQIHAFWRSRPDASLVHIALHVTALVTALVTLGAIAHVARALRGRALWSSMMAAVGMGVMALSNARYLALERVYARAFVEARPDAQAAIAMVSASLSLDAYGVLEFGTIAVWVIAVTAALPGRSKGLIVAGAVAALGLSGLVVGSAVWPPALDIAPAIGTPALIAWWVLLAQAMRQP